MGPSVQRTADDPLRRRDGQVAEACPDLLDGGVPLPLDVRPSPFHEGLGLLARLVHFLGAEPVRRFPRLLHDELTFTPGLGYLLLDGLLRRRGILPRPVGGLQAFPDAVCPLVQNPQQGFVGKEA